MPSAAAKPRVEMKMSRVILFVEDMDLCADFYENKLGLKIARREEGFIDFDAGDCRIALHKGTSRPGRTKICFYAKDVSAARKALVDAGVAMGKDPGSGPGLKLCNGKDPEGNIFQLSSR